MNSKDYLTKLEYYTLTHPEKRIWYVEKIFPDTSMFNIGGTIRLKGTIDFLCLERSINLFVKNNEGVRLRFIEYEGKCMQYLADYEYIKIDFFDFSKNKNPEIEFNNWVNEEAKKPFIINNRRLFYFAIFKISENDNGYLSKIHHIIADGWAMKLVSEYISNSYIKLINGGEICNDIEYSYIDYIENEQNYLKSNRFQANKKFWNECFKVIPQNTLAANSNNTKGLRKTFYIEEEKSNLITNFIELNKNSLNTFFISIFLIYAVKSTNENIQVIGTPVLNRYGRKELNTFGMLAGVIPFLYKTDMESTMLDMIKSVSSGLKACYLNQKYPYDILVQDLELKKKGFDDLYNVCVNYYHTKYKTELNGVQAETQEFYNGNQAYSLQLIIRDWSDTGNITLDFDYKVDLFSEQQIEKIYNQINNIIDQILINPSIKIGEISLVSELEKNISIYEFNSTKCDYPYDRMIYQLFEDQVIRTPQKVAITYKGNELTYKELNERSNQLARKLIDEGVQNEKIVGLMMIHSMETIIGILAILKAGGAYLPLDPTYPIHRINYLIEDSKVDIILTNISVNELNFYGKIIDFNESYAYIGDSTNIELLKKSSDLAYIIYTSGSSGQPKGVMIEHQGLVNYICWAKKMYVKNDNEVFPLYSSLSFDLTITSIFTPLISGSQIRIYQDNEDEYVLNRIMKDNKVTVLKLTPAHLSLIKELNNTNSSVKRLIVGGDNLKVSLSKSIYESFNGGVEIFNEYGPTETVVGCMIYQYDYHKDSEKSVPIGLPADNVQVYILDNQLNAVPNECIGEIYISGDGIARGYINKPDLSNERFMQNPFLSEKRMYKTGDLAKRLEDGNIMYIGRVDNQVKIRGFRIELGEIEAQLLKHEKVKEAVVIDIEDNESNKNILAYVVVNEKLIINELKEFLSIQLPAYMIPACFMEIDSIPLTPNGKVDRTLLPKLENHLEVEDAYVGYRDEVEKLLVEIISNILNLEKVSMRDNFYQIGGDSIKAIQIASKLNEANLKIKAKDILEKAVIEEIAASIEVDNNVIVVDQEPCRGWVKPTPIINWFFSHNFKNPNHYNQSVLIELKQEIKVKDLEIVISKLIEHHDALRMNYGQEKKALYFNDAYLLEDNKIEIYNLSGMSSSERDTRILQIYNKVKASFNIEKGLLFKACLIKQEDYKVQLLLTAHHLIVDGVSWRILLDDINYMLNQLFNRQIIKLPQKTQSIKKWAELIEGYINADIYKEVDYWKSVIDKEFAFPTDYTSAEDTKGSGKTITGRLEVQDTVNLLLNANKAYNTDIRDLLIVSLIKTIKQFSHTEKIVIEMEGHGREDVFNSIDISRTVGWFTSIYPFYIRLNNNDLSSQIRLVKEQIRKIPNNGFRFGILKYLSKSISDNNEKRIRFNFLGDFDSQNNSDFYKVLNTESGEDISEENLLTCLLDINCFIMDKELNVKVTYSNNLFYLETMERFLEEFIDNVKIIIKHCCNKREVEFTPSDFDTVDISMEDLDSLLK